MKALRTALSYSTVVILVLLVAGCAKSSQPNLPPKESIPADIPDEVRTKILMLYSSSPV